MNLTEGQLFTIEALNRIEGFVWPEKAKFAAMDEDDFRVHFYRGEPRTYSSQFLSYGTHATARNAGVKHPDWRNSLITREQFDSVDGWVRNDGNEPAGGVSGYCRVDVKHENGIIDLGFSSDGYEWGWQGDNEYRIVAWRHHKPTKETEMQNPKPYKKRDCIETLIDKRKDAIEQKRLALATLEEAEAKERELMLSIQAWAESYGFDIRVLDESDEVPEVEPNKEPELVITDWRDLRVGDVVWWSGAGCIDSGEYAVSNVESNDYKGSTAFCVSCAHGLEWVSTKFEKWKFIRRPSK